MKATKKSGPLPANQKYRVLVVDDHPLVRQGIAQIISSDPGLQVCGQCGTAADAIAAVRELKPDLAIVDISLGDSSGVQLIKDIRAMTDTTLILVASMHDESVYAERIIRGGANGYIGKEAPPEQFLAAVRQVLAGQVYLSGKVSSQLLHRLVDGHAPGPKSSIDSLSDRELEVFQFIGKGMRTREIADHLCLSIKTIETYRENIKAKLNLSHSGELVRHAVQWQIADSESKSTGQDARP